MKKIFAFFTRTAAIRSCRVLPFISIIVLVAFLNLITGCNYYKVRDMKPLPNNTTEFKKMQEDQKYIILHQGKKVWHLKDITLNDEKKELRGMLEALPDNHQYYLTTNPDATNRYMFRKGNPTIEVHIYISEYAEAENSEVIVPVSAIHKIEIYDKDISATVASYVFGTLGVVAATFVVLLIIVALTKSSCPFVYTGDGQQFRFAGEMYGGAIYSSLERDDYMPLPGFAAANGVYNLKITNELLERQYTNLAQLMLIEHPENTQVIIDKNGNIQTLSAPQAPEQAISDKNTDHKRALSARDSNSYLFNDDNTEDNNLSNITLTYKKPLHAKSGKLILNARNSLWLDYIYGKFNEQFGSYYNKFAEQQKNVPAKKNNQWALEQGILLSVYIETENGWEFIDYFNVIGPLASRDIVMPLDLTKIKGENVKIKLECGFMFWEIDYAVMDFSENLPVEISHISPTSAIDENGNEVSSLLAATDDQYLVQPKPGNAVLIKYQAKKPEANMRQSTFLHSRGYYEYIRDYKGIPNLVYLNSFKKKGAFTRFSKKTYFGFVDNKNLIVNVLSSNYGN